jgi:uncharacterized protein (TIGR02145 family)
MKTNLFRNIVETRHATSLLVLLLVLLLAFAGCKKDDDKTTDTPPFAASTQTWTFGDQIWSDAIQCPECNKETSEESDTEPDCSSYADAESGKTFYYFNWPYVDAKKNTMCPDPWRVPTKEDFVALVETLGGNTPAACNALSTAWGYGGVFAGWSGGYVRSAGYYWSSARDSTGLRYSNHEPLTASVELWPAQGSWQQVRCVRDN